MKEIFTKTITVIQVIISMFLVLCVVSFLHWTYGFIAFKYNPPLEVIKYLPCKEATNQEKLQEIYRVCVYRASLNNDYDKINNCNYIKNSPPTKQ